MEDDSSTKSLCGATECNVNEENFEENFYNLDDKTIEEECLKRKLKFFFMNPIEKWKTKQRFPFKLCILIGKIFLVTTQLYFFAQRRTVFVDFVMHNRIAFSHLFLLGWESSREITAYPPQTGELAVYKISDFYSVIDFAVINYVNLDQAIGSYSYPCDDSTKNYSMATSQMCFKFSKKYSEIDYNTNNSKENNNVFVNCIVIKLPKGNPGNFSSENFFRQNNMTIDFSSLLNANLFFEISTIHNNLVALSCFKFNVSILFNNALHDGRLKYSLDITIDKGNCLNKTLPKPRFNIIGIVNYLVLVACTLSGLLCGRAFIRANRLRRKTAAHFLKYYHKTMSWKGFGEFINWWYVMMVISDLLIFMGSSLKEKIEQNDFSGDDLNICSLILGLGNFLVWFSILRYLCFFKTYNAIILTLKVATPALFRFMVCVMLIYSGFTFCGWLVLGPYHMKFRTLSGTSECLFALLNGDDVFGTFSTLQPTNSSTIWWFCRIYLYIFISLFIYVVLSLFVSIIVDAYEVITKSSKGPPKSDVREFIDSTSQESLHSLATSSIPDCSVSCRPQFFNLKNIRDEICCCEKFRRRHSSDS